MTAPRATSEALNSPVMSAERRAIVQLRDALREYLTVDALRFDEGCPIERANAVRVGAEQALANAATLVPDAGEPPR